MADHQEHQHTQRVLHPLVLSSADLQRLTPEKVLALCLRSQVLLSTLRAKLYQVQMPLSTRAVAMDLVLSQVPLKIGKALTSLNVADCRASRSLTWAAVFAAFHDHRRPALVGSITTAYFQVLSTSR